MLMQASSEILGLSRQSRPCPDDFEVVFVELGRLECESYYRARRTTVTRWLEERGKDRLIRKRAAFVKHQRQRKKPRRPTAAEAAVIDKRKVDRRLAELAASYLQGVRNGGWAIYARSDGTFVVGTCRKSAAELVDMAVRKGFNRRRAIEQIKAFAEPN